MKWALIILMILVICCCCGLILVLLLGGLGTFITDPGSGYLDTVDEVIQPERALSSADDNAYYTERILRESIVPENNPIDLASRLLGIKNIPLTVTTEPMVYKIGDSKSFWITNTDTNLSSSIEASLQYITEEVYFWVDNRVVLSDQDRVDIGVLMNTFNDKIIPTNRKFFGSEWSPGIDNDPRLFVLYARGLGNNIAGYFSSNDSLHPLAHKYSNAHEMFLLSADNTSLSDPFTFGVLAHEFQHMIHWHGDRNEETWLNEGFSELAAFLNGYFLGGFDYYFINNSDIQLTDWPTEQHKTTPHYGAAFLYVNYFLNRFGDDATKALVAHDENGMTSVDLVLEELGFVDPMTGEKIGADDVFADWVLSSYLKDETLDDGRYHYPNYPKAPQAKPTETHSNCPIDWQHRSVNQYGVNYIKISCSGDYTISFQGQPSVKVIPADSYSGDFSFWSNKGDESNMTLTRFFDFSDVKDEITIHYWTWYDIEEDYDYAYLSASKDGVDWDILTTPSGTGEDPSGNSYGWGYNGKSDGWIYESVEISQFAGEQVYLRFEYITDAAVNGEGFLLDDVVIPQIGYESDFEKDDGGWEAEGFVRISNSLPQNFLISILLEGKETSIQKYTLDAGESLAVNVSLGGDYDSLVLVVSGMTRFTRIPAEYSFRMK